MTIKEMKYWLKNVIKFPSNSSFIYPNGQRAEVNVSEHIKLRKNETSAFNKDRRISSKIVVLNICNMKTGLHQQWNNGQGRIQTHFFILFWKFWWQSSMASIASKLNQLDLEFPKVDIFDRDRANVDAILIFHNFRLQLTKYTPK